MTDHRDAPGLAVAIVALAIVLASILVYPEPFVMFARFIRGLFP